MSVGLVAWRGDKLRSPGRIDSAVSREAAFLSNNLLFAGFAFVVLIGTVFPLLVEALQNKQISVGEPYFTRLGVPIGIALLFLMAVGPVLPWRAASGRGAARPAADPGVGRRAHAGRRARRRRARRRQRRRVRARRVRAHEHRAFGRRRGPGAQARHGGGAPVAAVRTVRTNPRLYGGLLVHAGVVVVAIALATTGGYTTKSEVALSPGESARVRGYTVTYLGREVDQSAQKTTIKARVARERRSASSHPRSPRSRTRPRASARRRSTPTPWHDVYLTLVSSPTSGRVTIGVQVGTMVMFLWIGGLIMALGCALALVPARKRDVLARAIAGARPDDDVTRRGAGAAAQRREREATSHALDRARGRRRAGRRSAWCSRSSTGREPSVPRLVLEHAPAPSFTLQGSTASTITSAQLKDKTYVVNFFNSWCIPCQQEAPRSRRSTPSTRTKPTSRWSASSSTTMPRRCAATCGPRSITLAGRRSTRTAARR